MATTEPRINDNVDPLKNILDILGQFGTGTTTSKSSTEPGAASSAQADALMASIQQSVNPDSLAQLVQGILLKAKTAFGPNIAASIGAGNRTTSDSALAQLQSEAASRATAESAQAILDAQNNAAKLATSIVNTKLNASRNTTQTSRTGVSPAGKAIIGLSAAQKGKKLLGIGDETKGVDKTPAPEALGYSPEQLASLAGPEQLAGPGFDTSGSAAVTDVIPGGGGINNPFLGDSGDLIFGDSGGSSNSSSGSLDNPFVGDSGDSSIPEDTGVQIRVGGPQPDQPGNFDPGGAVGGGSGDSGGIVEPPPEEDTGCFLCWIVCTELHRQGKLPTRWYIPGSRVFAKYDDNIKRGYYFWAIPLSKHLRNSPDSLLSKITTIGCNHRAEFIANRAGIRGARKTFRGFFVIHSLYWACWFLGKVLPKRIQFTEESGYGRARN